MHRTALVLTTAECPCDCATSRGRSSARQRREGVRAGGGHGGVPPRQPRWRLGAAVRADQLAAGGGAATGRGSGSSSGGRAAQHSGDGSSASSRRPADSRRFCSHSHSCGSKQQPTCSARCRCRGSRGGAERCGSAGSWGACSTGAAAAAGGAHWPLPGNAPLGTPNESQPEVTVHGGTLTVAVCQNKYICR